MNKNRIRKGEGTSNEDEQPAKRARRSTSSENKDQILFKPDCIFCGKEGRKKVFVKKAWSTEGLSSFSHGGGDIILKVAEERNDEHLARRIRGVDLFAAEAKYHISCRKKYVEKGAWRSMDYEAKKKAGDLQETHDLCFAKVCKVIDRHIVMGKEVMKMTDLSKLYIEYLSATPFANPDYRTEKLKDRLIRHEVYSTKLSFVALDRRSGQLQSELVFSNELDLSTAVKHGYMLGCADEVWNVSTLLRKVIMNAFDAADKLPWPPTASYLETVPNPVPESLQRFLRVLISGQDAVGISEKIERLVSSIGQDLCRAATKGHWKLPKHILVCMTLRHLFRSAQISTLMHRLGHAESYTFSLELETALALALDEASSLLTPQIIRNPTTPAVFHSDFDNFDQFVNDLSGSGSVHTAHGIMLQDIPEGFSNEVDMPVIPIIPRTGERSLKSGYLNSDTLPSCYVGSQRDGPKMTIKHLSMPESEGALPKSNAKNLAWCIIRKTSSTEGQVVPGWAGFISETGISPTKLTTIDYYPIINHPITDNATVQECLRFSKQASDDVGQKYAITTFDLGVCMKAYPIIWKSPETYKDHIVMIGTFHVVCAYLKMVGKKMAGSGLSDIMLESGLMSSGSIQGVLSGKNYSRAIQCHKVMVEALERTLLTVYEDLEDFNNPLEGNEQTKERMCILKVEPNKDNFEILMKDPHFVSYLHGYTSFREEVKNGQLGKTAQFWLSYMDHIWLVLSLLLAVKTNDYRLYGACLHQMADLFFSFDGQNYARYLTFFSLFLSNIEETHPGATEALKLGAISVARSFVPGNRCAVDKTIEETFMKHAKSHAGAGGRGAGLSGILQNYEAYKRWARTAHERTRYLEVTLEMADMSGESGRGNKHRDTRPSQVRKSETSTRNAVKAIESFLNPFTAKGDDDQLLCVASGAAATPDISKDILEAEKKGKLLKDEFVKDRLQKDQDFFKPIKKQKLKTFENMSKKVLVRTTKNREVEYKNQGNVAFQLLVLSQHQPEKLDMKELMKYPLMPVPSSIGTADGFLLKTDKSKGFHYLTKAVKDSKPPPTQGTINIEDGNATFYCMKDVPRTFRQIGHKLLDMTTTGRSSVIFSTDMYKIDSVKAMERSRRGCGEKRTVQGENTRRPENWKDFLTNDENKQQLARLILKVWSSTDCAEKLRTKEVIVVSEGRAYSLISDGETVNVSEIQTLESDQEETDTRVILYCTYAESQQYEHVRVRSPDSDIFFILLYYAARLRVRLLFDTGSGDHRRLLDITQMAKDFTPTYCAALLGLHAYTRCDTTSGFKGIGKVKPIKLLKEKPRFQEVFSTLGEKWKVSDDVLMGLEQFTCQMYKRAGGITEVDELRYTLLISKCGGGELSMKRKVDLSMFPPPRVCLGEHIKRVNYQVGIWKRAHIAKPYIPAPTDNHGWTSTVDGGVEPLWCSKDILPPKIADLLEEEKDAESSDVEELEYSTEEESDEESESDSDW